MNTYRVYVSGYSNVPGFLIDAANAGKAKDVYRGWTRLYLYPSNKVVVELFSGSELKETDYAYKLDKWRKEHKNKPWTGTVKADDTIEDLCMRVWMNEYVNSCRYEEMPITAIREFRRMVEMNQ